MITSIQFTCPAAKKDSLISNLIKKEKCFSYQGKSKFIIQYPSNELVGWIKRVDPKCRIYFDGSKKKAKSLTQEQFYEKYPEKRPQFLEIAF